jgi:serine protease Do
MRKFISFAPALLVLATVLLVLIAGPTALHRLSAAQTSANIMLARQTIDQDDILERLNAAVRNVAASVRPSVVHIDVGPQIGSFRLSTSTGTGWVYDDSGHIVTNLHVIRGAREITVQFASGRVVKAEEIHGQPFVGDPFTDVAIIKVPRIDGLHPARRASGIQPQQGDRVFAFGSPFGFKFSMSEGIISGLGRDPMTAVEFGGFTNFIQTDAAVNPGNSGGPLVDIRGRVVGMNVAIATGRESQGTTEGQSSGISFAIPLGTVEAVVQQLIGRGTVSRGFLGVAWGGREDPVVFDEGLGRTAVRIASVNDGGPAAAAGLQPGDLITEIHGHSITGSEGLRATVTSFLPGEEVTVTAWRDGTPKEFTVRLGEFPPENLAHDAGGGALRRYGLIMPDRSNERPVIRIAIPNSAAHNAGFEQGHLVLGVADREVSTTAEVFITAVEAGLLQGWPVEFVVAHTPTNGEDTKLEPRKIEVRLTR